MVLSRYLVRGKNYTVDWDKLTWEEQQMLRGKKWMRVPVSKLQEVQDRTMPNGEDDNYAPEDNNNFVLPVPPRPPPPVPARPSRQRLLQDESDEDNDLFYPPPPPPPRPAPRPRQPRVRAPRQPRAPRAVTKRVYRQPSCARASQRGVRVLQGPRSGRYYMNRSKKTQKEYKVYCRG